MVMLCIPVVNLECITYIPHSVLLLSVVAQVNAKIAVITHSERSQTMSIQEGICIIMNQIIKSFGQGSVYN